MEELISTLTSEWALRALITSSMVGITCGVIGCFIVLRNMSLIGDALAHAILPGVFVAFLIFGYSTVGFFLGSVIAGLFTAFGITWIQHNVKTKNDAAIGIVFTAMFALGVMGISWISQKDGVHLDLTDFLFGTVLGISNEDIYLTAGVMIYTLVSVYIFYRYLFITTFQSTIAQTMGISVKMVHYFLMLLLSIAVVSALQSVGVILVVAMLITPASTALLLSNKLKQVLVISATIGFFSAIMGLILSILFNTNPGPAMTVTVTIIYLLTAVFAPEKGLFFSKLRKRSQARKIEMEDILKQSIKGEVPNTIHKTSLITKLGLSKRRLNNLLRSMMQHAFIRKQNEQLILTKVGIEKANELVRAHRLWETYQVKQMGLTQEQIHEEAEDLEHFLTDDILFQVDQKLGFPTTDPHGSPIPPTQLKRSNLFAVELNSMVKISSLQLNDRIESELWELGLMPKSKITLVSKSENKVEIKFKKSSIFIDESLAKEIQIQE